MAGPALKRTCWQGLCSPRQDIERVAGRVRRLGPGSLPVRVVPIAHALGLSIVARALPDGVEGALFRYERGAVIVYDPRRPSERIRFTVAHEIGHWVLGRSGVVACHCEELRDRAEERRANRFAAALLMPREDAVACWMSGKAFTSMAARYEVSLEAMHWRLVELGLV